MFLKAVSIKFIVGKIAMVVVQIETPSVVFYL